MLNVLSAWSWLNQQIYLPTANLFWTNPCSSTFDASFALNADWEILLGVSPPTPTPTPPPELVTALHGAQ